MVWKGDSWEEIVRRSSARTRTREPAPAPPVRETPEELAARAEYWSCSDHRVYALDEGLRIGGPGSKGVAIDIPYRQLFRVEPVEPWPCLAVGWVDGEHASQTTLRGSYGMTHGGFAEMVEEAVKACEKHAPEVTSPGWLSIPVHPWEPVARMPAEGDKVPMMHTYRTAPEAPDPILAVRTIGRRSGRLKRWFFGWLLGTAIPKIVSPREVVVTQHFVYALTIDGRALRVPRELLRTARPGTLGAMTYVFARDTHLLLPGPPECPARALLDAQLGS